MMMLTMLQEEQGVSGGEILSTRTYDLNITYDKFYQVGCIVDADVC